MRMAFRLLVHGPKLPRVASGFWSYHRDAEELAT